MIVPARLKPGTDEWSRFFYPTPTHENITTCVRKYSESKQAKDAIFLFDIFRHFPENKTREVVSMKVDALLDYMSNPVWIHNRYIIAHILSNKDFDRKLQGGVKTIVNKMADASPSKRDKYDTFARYYCAFHNPQHYLPGHWIAPALSEYERLDHFLQGKEFYWLQFCSLILRWSDSMMLAEESAEISLIRKSHFQSGFSRRNAGFQ